MKKIASIFLVVVLVICLSACNKPSVEEACSKADSILAVTTEGGYLLKGEYRLVGNTYYYYVEADLIPSAMESEWYDFVRTTSASSNAKELYPKLYEVLSEANIPIIIEYSDPDGKLIAKHIEGEMIWAD